MPKPESRPLREVYKQTIQRSQKLSKNPETYILPENHQIPNMPRRGSKKVSLGEKYSPPWALNEGPIYPQKNSPKHTNLLRRELSFGRESEHSQSKERLPLNIGAMGAFPGVGRGLLGNKPNSMNALAYPGKMLLEDTPPGYTKHIGKLPSIVYGGGQGTQGLRGRPRQLPNVWESTPKKSKSRSLSKEDYHPESLRSKVTTSEVVFPTPPNIRV